MDFDEEYWQVPDSLFTVAETDDCETDKPCDVSMPLADLETGIEELSFEVWLAEPKKDKAIQAICKKLDPNTEPDVLERQRLGQCHMYRINSDGLLQYACVPTANRPRRVWRTYVPESLRQLLIEMHHTNFGHRGIKPVVKSLCDHGLLPAIFSSG